MSETASATEMRALRFHSYGARAEVLRLETAEIPKVNAGGVRVRVAACGLNPADWALCLGLFPGDLPRGVGLDVSGVVDGLGEGVDDVQVGDAILGAADFAGYASAGVADRAQAQSPALQSFARKRVIGSSVPRCERGSASSPRAAR